MASGGSISAYLGTYVRIEFDWNGGTTTTDGAIAARLYPTPFSTTQVGAAYSNTAINTGSGVITTMQLQIGVTATYAAVLPVTAGYLQINDGAVSNPGPAPSASAPSVNAGADQYPDAGTTITLTSTESGTFISATWSVTSSLPTGVATPSIASPASATTNVPLPNAGVFTFRRRLVWSGGNQDDLITAWVHPVSGQDIIVLGEFDASTAYNLDGSATSRTAALNDTSQSTGIASLDDPDGTAEKKFVLCPVGLGPINALTEGYARGGAIATRTITLYKEDGTTAVDSWTHTPGLEIASISETTDAVDSGGLTAVPALSDRRALVVGFKATV
jgi:hypothetical protein